MSSRGPTDPIESAIDEHLQAIASLIGRRRNFENDDIIARLDLIFAKLASPTEYPVTWVKLEKYVELTGDSMDSVQARRRIGKWIDGKQCKIVDSRLWINLPAVEHWIETWDQVTPMRAALESNGRLSKHQE